MGFYGVNRYKRNGYCFDINGNPRRGIASESVKVPIKGEDPAAVDRENRRQVVKTIEESIKQGVELEKITAELANKEEIKQKFKYLSKLDLKEVFKGWYNGSVRPRKEVEKPIR